MQERDAAAYDLLPYDSVPTPQTHPDYLAALAVLAGFDSPDPSRARILELGCAEGGNLLPIAYYWPEVHCVGIELSRQQALTGQNLLRAAGIGNCRILNADLCKLPADLGPFDYIIAHGVYSWVPPPVQDGILDACASLLAPQGVAYLSFNVAPGWTSRQALRGLLRHAIAGHSAPAAQVAAARGELQRLAEHFTTSELAAHADLRAEVAFLLGTSPAYLFHEYLAEHNAPETLERFRQRAASRGLTFLCDAGPGLCASAWSGDDFEFPAGIRFSRALLIRSEARRPAGALRELSFHADLASEAEIDLSTPVAQSFVGPHAQDVVVTQPLAKAALLVLGSVYPSSLGWDGTMGAAAELLARYGTPQTESSPAFVAEWKGLMAAQAVWPGRVERRAHAPWSPHPRTHALARAQAATGAAVAGLRHRALDLDAAARRLLALLDGSRDRAALVAEMAAYLAAEDRAPAADVLSAAVDRYLSLFARNGLLLA